MLFVSTYVSETTVVFPVVMLLKYGDASHAFVVSPIGKNKKVVMRILSTLSRICHKLNMCVCLPGLVVLP